MAQKKKQEKIRKMIVEISSIIDRARALEKTYAKAISKTHPKFRKSAKNLVHYKALRITDTRSLQKRLGNLGLSNLAKSDSHVMASLLSNKAILEGFISQKMISLKRAELTIKKSNQIQKSNSKILLGYRTRERFTRIMVTIPSEVANNYKMAHDMIASGMSCARINCAHDEPVVWKKMIDNIRKASVKLRMKCKIMMDLGGPKIRTGTLTAGPKVRRFKPIKDSRGAVIKNCAIWMGPENHPDRSISHLPVIWDNMKSLEEGKRLYLKDSRNKKRTFEIKKISQDGCILHASKTTYVETGMPLYLDKDYVSSPIRVGEIPPLDLPIILNTGSFLRIHKENIDGNFAPIGKHGKEKSPAHLSCTLPVIIDQVKVGEPIFFDDGKIEGIIKETNSKEILIEIVHAKAGGGKLRADKGINLPTSNLNISGLTAKDKKDLIFVVQNADVVNLSFVNSTQDVADLMEELKKLKAPNSLGIILKIESQSGFNNLTDILLKAMQWHPIGVMIARGDLAIECGWNNIGRVQEEILSICQAANVPDVWATQVLENLSKVGIPSRAEITDAVMAQRADAVLLNKGPYILESIKLLDTILKDMAPYQEKYLSFLPKMKKADIHSSK